jgi:hypothetical protein
MPNVFGGQAKFNDNKQRNVLTRLTEGADPENHDGTIQRLTEPNDTKFNPSALGNSDNKREVNAGTHAAALRLLEKTWDSVHDYARCLCYVDQT